MNNSCLCAFNEMNFFSCEVADKYPIQFQQIYDNLERLKNEPYYTNSGFYKFWAGEWNRLLKRAKRDFKNNGF